MDTPADLDGLSSLHPVGLSAPLAILKLFFSIMGSDLVNVDPSALDPDDSLGTDPCDFGSSSPQASALD